MLLSIPTCRPAFLSRPGLSISIHIRNRQSLSVQTRFNSTTTTTTTESTEDTKPIEDDVEQIEDAEPNEDTDTTSTTTTSHHPKRRARPFIHFKRRSDPLRILFCGSDAFSCASLRALHALQHSDSPSSKLIKSIDVLVRPGKPAGRGLKRVAVGPLYHLAEELGLPIHKRDTFTGWDLPPAGHITHHETGEVIRHRAAHDNSHRQPFNLIVAVSFGLFVPPRVLNSVRYGGVNVHPSILPDLRGPAPLQHALLCNRTHVGATLQTLHHRDFDRGSVLAQTPYPPGIPIPGDCDVQQLHDLLAEEGARLLVDGLKQRMHVPPYDEDNGWKPTPEDVARGLLRDAPKIRKADAEVDWAGWTWGRDRGLCSEGEGNEGGEGPCWTAADLARRFRAVGVKLAGEGQAAGGGNGGLWTRAITARHPTEKRVIFEDVTAVRCPDRLRDVVLSAVQAKTTEGPAPWLTEETGEVLLPKEISSVVFSMVSQQGTQQAGEFRLPYMSDGTSIILPIKVPYAVKDGLVSSTVEEDQPDAVRIETIKVEGSTSKPAAHAMAEFKENKLTVRDISSLEFAMDVMTRLVK
ncbi:hypothetical protein VMCG_08136 [Cytospora schulzeri]|uniref:methionyl-tRNA formyltransferase n=1 Tax=Cytospora schulzeri TaxID=448051 RepID=A0A423VTU6_9PEZI|nr:hypothetical protein VMCG_08136 [Valsa malicola]